MFLVIAELCSGNKLGSVEHHEHQIEHGHVDEDCLARLEELHPPSHECGESVDDVHDCYFT